MMRNLTESELEMLKGILAQYKQIHSQAISLISDFSPKDYFHNYPEELEKRPDQFFFFDEESGNYIHRLYLEYNETFDDVLGDSPRTILMYLIKELCRWKAQYGPKNYTNPDHSVREDIEPYKVMEEREAYTKSVLLPLFMHTQIRS